MDKSTGVGVLDKLDLILSAVATGPLALGELAADTDLPRPTAHRLATALVALRYLERDDSGRYLLGPKLTELASGLGDDWLITVAQPVLTQLRDHTGESAQLYRRHRQGRLCVASVEPAAGLRDSVPAGTVLPMSAGSAAQVLCAWQSPDEIAELVGGAKFNARDLAKVRSRGWAHSAAEREPGLASISAPVFDGSGFVAAAVSVSGPIERIGRATKGEKTRGVVAAAATLTEVLTARGGRG